MVWKLAYPGPDAVGQGVHAAVARHAHQRGHETRHPHRLYVSLHAIRFKFIISSTSETGAMDTGSGRCHPQITNTNVFPKNIPLAKCKSRNLPKKSDENLNLIYGAPHGILAMDQPTRRAGEDENYVEPSERV